MKAVFCTKYGPPEVLKIREIEKPVPKDNEVLIMVRATTVAVADSRIRSFTVPAVAWLPARLILGITKPRKPILGVELAGEIESVGKGVKNFKPGDKVFAATLMDFGGHAEYTCIPENGPMVLKPENISFEEAAALPIGARTALHFLQKGNIGSGQNVLVYGASGSVGTYAVQLAKHYGAKVTGVCSNGNFELVKSLGAEKVVDYTKPDFMKELEQYDMIFLAIDKFPFSICNQFLKEGGVYVNVTNPVKSFAMIWASMKSKKKFIMGGGVPETPEFLGIIRDFAASGALKVVIDRRYPFDQIVEAHRYVDDGHKKGNVVITV